MRKLIDNENGAVLITGLVMLLILTLIGITAIQSSTLEEKMAGNLNSRNLAFQAAEMALRDAENFLTAATLPPFAGTSSAPASSGLYQPRIDVTSLAWDVTDSAAFSGATPAGVAAAPRYIIEELGDFGDSSASGSVVAGTEVEENSIFRVTAYGVGATSNVVVVLQSTYAR